MKVYGRLIAALLVAGGLSGCGVAVDQRTLAPVVAAPSPPRHPPQQQNLSQNPKSQRRRRHRCPNPRRMP